MPRPAFFVDGFTEMRILQQICPEAVIRRLNINGESVKMAAIAKVISFQYKLLGNGCYPVHILIDREQRTSTCEELIKELSAEMELIGLPTDQFRIGVCDRMIENWILADKELISTKFGKEMEVTDGDHGKSKLRALYTRDSPYQETVHGVELLVQASAARIALNSPSFAEFRQQIALDCFWLNA